MHSPAWLLIAAGLGYALPAQESCATTTSEVIIPTTTATYTTNPVVTVHATGAEDLGTFTLTTTISDTTTVETITSTIGVCGATGVITVPAETTTVYTNAPGGYKRARDLNPRDGCTVTVTSTTTYGQTYTFVAGNSTSTFYDYTDFTQATVTSTKTGGRDWAIASAVATTTTSCGDSTVTEDGTTSTVTLDARCSPSAMISAYDNYGIEWLSDTPAAGATYETTTDDASDCCQLCAEADKCAASAWDIRSGVCKLEFPVDFDSGSLNCGEGLLGYYDAGPNNPMAPGTGWYVAEVCGNAEFGSAQPDDGS